MFRQVAAVCTVMLLLGIGVGSATSLGSFNSVNLEGTAFEIEHCPGAATAIDTTDSPVPLDTVLSVAVTVDTVELSGLDSSCEGLIPNVVIIGETLLDPSERVLGVLELPPIGVGSTQSLPALDPVSLSVGTYVTEIRIAYLPN